MPARTKTIGRDTYMQVEGTKMWKKVYGPSEHKPFEQSLEEWHTSYFGEWLPDSSNKTEKKKKPRLIAFVNDKCTGCLDCVEFCPVDCIDISPRSLYDDDYSPTKTIMIRFDECIGCELCAKACISANSNYECIDMVETPSFEEEHEVGVSNDLVPRPVEEYYDIYKGVLERKRAAVEAP